MGSPIQFFRIFEYRHTTKCETAAHPNNITLIRNKEVDGNFILFYLLNLGGIEQTPIYGVMCMSSFGRIEQRQRR